MPDGVNQLMSLYLNMVGNYLGHWIFYPRGSLGYVSTRELRPTQPHV